MRSLLSFLILLFPATLISQTYALIADRLIDGQSDQAFENPTIIIYKNRIVDINYSQTVPDSAVVIRLKGYTVLPGLMDVHTHLLADGIDYNKDLYGNSPSFRALRAAQHLNIALQNGFTTLRDVCTEGAGFADIDLRRALDSGFITGPRLFASGRGIAATGNYVPFPSQENWELSLPSGTQQVTGVDECIKAVREQVSRGVQWIKLFADWRTPTFSAEEMQTVVKEAGKFSVAVAAHASSRQAIVLAIHAGVRSIEHGDEFDDSLVQMAKEKNVYWCPTVTVNEYFAFPRLNKVYSNLNAAYRKKMLIAMGSDIGSFPWTVNEAKELEYYVKKAGFSPMDAIKTATLNTAALLNRQNDLGQIRKNFLADIIAVKGNPLNDINLLQQVAFVMKDGKIYKQPIMGQRP